MAKAPSKKAGTGAIELKHYDIVVKPVITEKSTLVSEYNQGGFEGANGASKPEIKAAVEALFSVQVTTFPSRVRPCAMWWQPRQPARPMRWYRPC